MTSEEFDENTNDNDNKIKFLKLTPTKCDNMNGYNEALDFVFENDDLCNIAVTGAYSAGKSSVIQTYDNNNLDKKFIYLSLANFKEVDVKPIVGDTPKTEKKDLEGKILNHIIHQISSNKIPYSRFKIKKATSGWIIFIHALIYSLACFALVYMINFSTIKKLFASPPMKDAQVKGDMSLIIAFIVFILSSSIIIYRIVRLFLTDSKLKKIAIKNYEIEMFDKNDDSYFDKYLDEILYIFEYSDVHVIVFEDIDRYNSNLIFTKLREINYLVNSKLQNKCKKSKNQKTLRFFYLLRDDIFLSKDRTKFFDFILPIVPIMDSSNSYGHIKSWLGERLDKLYNNNFLENLCYFIDDMRILKNICNEFFIYSERIKVENDIDKTHIDDDKLLSMVAYKNLFPKDFSCLQLNKGYIYYLLNDGKKQLIKDKTNSIDIQIHNNLEKIETMKKESCSNLDEIDALYLLTEAQYRLSTRTIYNYQYNNQLSYVRELEKNRNIEDIKEAFDRLNDIPEYKTRKEALVQKLDNGIAYLEKQNSNLKLRKEKLDGARLFELLNSENSEELFKSNKYEYILQDDYFDLIKFLIKNGHIDETFHDYVTYFENNNLSYNDKIFYKHVLYDEAINYDYKLDNVNLVYDKLNIKYNNRLSIVNLDLISCLLEKNDDDKLKAICCTVSKYKKFDFIWDYINSTKQKKGRFIYNINCVWKDVFNFLFSDDKITEEQKHIYAVETIYSICTEERASLKNEVDGEVIWKELSSLNDDNIITNYICDSDTFLNIHNPNIDSILCGFLALSVKFKKINYDISDKELYNNVYNHDCYEINEYMLKQLIELKYGNKYKNDFEQRNYSIISSKPEEPLAKYVESNINDYFGVMFENNKSNIINDDEKFAIKLLNKTDEINLDKRKEYVNRLQTKINRLSEINDKDIWETLISHNKIIKSYENAIYYFITKLNGIDTILLNYINNMDEDAPFDLSQYLNVYKDTMLINFHDKIIASNEININEYKKITSSYHLAYNNFQSSVERNWDEDKLQKERIVILIQLKVITLTKENLDFIKVYYHDLYIMFIKTNINSYITFMTNNCEDNNIVDDVLTALLKANISNTNKIELMKFYGKPIKLDKVNLERLKCYIIRNQFDVNDLKNLMLNYNKHSKRIKKAVEDVYIIYIDEICNFNNITREFIEYIIGDNRVEYERKINILSNNIHRGEKEYMIKYLKILNKYDFVNILNNKTYQLTANICDKEKQLFHKFKELNWIKSIKDIENDNKVLIKSFKK